MKRKLSILSILAGVICLILTAGIKPGNAAGPQGQAARREAKNPRNLCANDASAQRRRTDTFRSRPAPAYLTWAYAIQGDREDEARGAFSAADGGIIFWGDTRILGGESLAWMTKLSPQGPVEWSRVYVGGSGTIFRDVMQTADGGFVAAGLMWGASMDAIVVKIAPSGLVEWGALFGSEWGDAADSVQQTSDGGYIVAGVTNAYYEAASTDFWVSKLTSTGDVAWSFILGGLGAEGDFSNGAENATVRQSSDGGYFLAGSSDSGGAGGKDIWIFKLASWGGVEWQKTYGGTANEEFPNGGPHLVSTSDGGLIVASATGSFGSTNSDGWLFKVTAEGDIAWQKLIGGPRPDTFNTIQATSDGGYVIGGVTISYPSDGFRHGWMLKLDSAMAIQWQWSYGANSNFYIQGVHQGADGSYAAGGCRTPTAHTSWYWDVYRDAFVLKTGPDGVAGVPGNAFMTLSEATVTDTDAVASDMLSSSRPGFETKNPIHVDFVAASPQGELLSWNGLQPPIDLVLTRETDRGLFKAEALNTLHWGPNPWNIRYDVISYGIYRQPLGDSAAAFQKVATVPSNTLAYIDRHLGLAEKYSYLVTSIDAQGHESPLSQAVRN